jgi:hypothetical protein
MCTHEGHGVAVVMGGQLSRSGQGRDRQHSGMLLLPLLLLLLLLLQGVREWGLLWGLL